VSCVHLQLLLSERRGMYIAQVIPVHSYFYICACDHKSEIRRELGWGEFCVIVLQGYHVQHSLGFGILDALLIVLGCGFGYWYA